MNLWGKLCLGLALMVAGSGCYCWSPYGGCGYSNGCGYNSGGYGCQYGNCGVTPPGVTTPSTPPGAFYNSYDSIQAAAPTPAISAAPYGGPSYPMTAAAPLESLPTY